MSHRVTKKDFEKLYKMCGGSLAELLQNINNLHAHLRQSHFKNFHPPSFRVTDANATSLKLHYIPGKESRKGLSRLVVGIVKGLAELVFNLDPSKIKILLLKSAEKGADHDVFYISWRKTVDVKAVKKEASSSTLDRSTQMIGLDGNNFNIVFPFHFILNKRLQFIQIGTSLKKLLKMEGNLESFVSKFEMLQPKTEISFKILRKLSGELITLRSKSPKIEFRGEFLQLNDTTSSSSSSRQQPKVLCFVGTPNFATLKDVTSAGLCLSDFAIHDPTKDVIFHSDVEMTRRERSPFGSETDSDDWSESVDSNSSLGRDRSISSKLNLGAGCPIPQINSGKYAVTRTRTPNSSNGGGSGDFIPASSPSLSYRCPNYSLLSEVLVKDSWNKFEITKIMIERSIGDDDSSTLIETLLSIYESLGKIDDLLTQCVMWEIRKSDHQFGDEQMMINNDGGRSDHAKQMLRQDNAASMLLSAYTKRLTLPIIKKLVSPLITEIAASKIEYNNFASLSPLFSDFLNQLIKSAPSWPQEFTKLLARMIKIVSEKRDIEFALCAVNSLLYLRLIVPAIAIPINFGVAPSHMIMENQKTLVTISKIMLNLAVGLKFADESENAIFNSLLNHDNLSKLDTFVNSLLDNSQSSSKHAHHIPPLSTKQLSNLSSYLVSHLPSLYDLGTKNECIKSLICELVSSQFK